MARDPGLEALMTDELADWPSIETRRMFGGMAWMYRGHLLCGARSDGILLRLGKGNDGEALKITGVAPMVMGERPMEGWVRLAPDRAADGALLADLLGRARAFVEGLPERI